MDNKRNLRYKRYKINYFKNQLGGKLSNCTLDVENPMHDALENCKSDLSYIKDNFSECSYINDTLCKKNNTHIILLFGANHLSFRNTYFSTNENLFYENLILNFDVQKENIHLINTFSDNTEYDLSHTIGNIYNSNINGLDNILEILHEIKRKIIETNINSNILFFVAAHGIFRYYNSENLFSCNLKNAPDAIITIPHIYDWLDDFYTSTTNNYNITFILNNCFSNYILHKYLVRYTQNLNEYTNTKLFSYSVRPFYKYILLSHIVLSFINKDFINLYNGGLLSKKQVLLMLIRDIKSIVENDDDYKMFFYYTMKTTPDETISNLVKLISYIEIEDNDESFFPLFEKIIDQINIETLPEHLDNITVDFLNRIDLYNDENIRNKLINILTYEEWETIMGFISRGNETSTYKTLSFNDNITIESLNNKYKNNPEKTPFELFVETTEMASMIHNIFTISRTIGGWDEDLPYLFRPFINKSIEEQKFNIFIPIHYDSTVINERKNIVLKTLF